MGYDIAVHRATGGDTRSWLRAAGRMCAVERILSPGELLDARHEVVPFHGRVEELATLTRWRDEGGRASLLLLHGPPGVGKTRLAHRFAAGGGVLVVDDADLVPWHELHQVLQEQAGRVRLLVVARDADWWWSALRQRAADLGYTAAELALAPCPEEHPESFRTACCRFAGLLGLPRPDVPTPPAETLHDLHLAALAAVHGSPASEPVALVRWLADLDPDPPAAGRHAEDVLAVALLDDRIEPDRTPHALAALLRAAGRWPHVLRRAEALFTAEPDLVANVDAGPLTALATRPEVARAIARRVFEEPRFHGDVLPAVLTRTLLRQRAAVADKPELAELHGMLGARAAIAALRAEALAAARTEVALYRELVAEDPAEYRPALADALGDLSLRLVAVGREQEALAVSAEAAAQAREAVEDDEECTPQLAAALERLGVRNAALGRRADALAAVSHAALLYQELHEARPALFRLDLAKITHHLAVRLHEVGRRVEAGDAARSAVWRWRAVVAADPRYEAEFARTLGALANLLAVLGLGGEAEVAAGGSIEVLRRLAAANPRDFEPELATALGALGAVLRGPDRRADALAAAEEAVRLWRRIARDGDPRAVGRLAAALLDQLDVPVPGDRLPVAQEAVDLLRPLAERYPARFAAAFAAARCRLAGLLLATGREHAARQVVANLVGQVPGPDARLARAWAALSDELAAVAHDEDALRCAEHAAECWRDLVGRCDVAARAYPLAVRRVAVLTHAARGLGALSRARQAVLAWHLVRTPGELAADPDYAEALTGYAVLCVQTRVELDRALAAAHRAVVVLRAARVAPDRFAAAVAAVEDVVRAHPDPQVARTRTRAMVARDWPSPA
ncbi:hypothetical protein [Saccharothrix obliqua]|uniref:hypothetical protein n=1 Tax=Saccharothrix obliqua TaxID=2861747 RepID=UPI001C602CE8|nr:hypothetical protein [Saccharothrix obliqua]MBW4720755.1 hypothetical protein [Saccharothrix obliqua]